MARYADGFLLSVPTRKLAEYRKMSQKAGKIWKEYGALEYVECVGDDLKMKTGMPFTKAAKAKPGETVVFSWIVYQSRAARDRINRKVMTDPRLANMMDPNSMPFDIKRMAYGGFRVMIDL